MEFWYSPTDPTHIKRERAKAKDLKKTQWWKQKLGKGVCFYCEERFSKDKLTMDHRIPLGRGGRTTKGNVVVSCKNCNTDKRALTSAEQKMQEMGWI